MVGQRIGINKMFVAMLTPKYKFSVNVELYLVATVCDLWSKGLDLGIEYIHNKPLIFVSEEYKQRVIRFGYKIVINKDGSNLDKGYIAIKPKPVSTIEEINELRKMYPQYFNRFNKLED